MTIERNINGIIDFCLNKVEEIDAREDIDLDKKAKLGQILAYLKEIRGFASENHKRLLIQAPDVAKNGAIVLPIGTAKKPEAVAKQGTDE